MKADDVMTNVGVIGAGRMGTPIIGHLVRKGFATQVFDVDAAKAGAMKGLGAKWAGSLQALAAESDAILICVGFDREVQELLAKGGPLRRAKPGTIVAILSTIHPTTVKRLADEAKESGLIVVDSTVCRGGEGGASDTGAAGLFSRCGAHGRSRHRAGGESGEQPDPVGLPGGGS
jgi:3-hydroxyisobutyrate dehydrogenase-like beta-hydroxyacid dehydrogenase